MSRLLAGLMVVLFCTSAHADPLRIAVASNFQATFEELVAAYSKQSSEQIEGTYDATGALYHTDRRMARRSPRSLPRTATAPRNSSPTAALRRRADSSTQSAGSRCGHRAQRRSAIGMAGGSATPHRNRRSANRALRARGQRSTDFDEVVGAGAIAPRHRATASRRRCSSSESKRASGGFVAQAQLIAHYKGKPPTADAWLVPLNMHCADRAGSGRAEHARRRSRAGVPDVRRIGRRPRDHRSGRLHGSGADPLSTDDRQPT